MRVMVMVNATKNSEAGMLPSEQLLTNMSNFNEALAEAGVLLAGRPSSNSRRITFSSGKRTVIGKELAPETRAQAERLDAQVECPR